jgi:hypothetical protein
MYLNIILPPDLLVRLFCPHVHSCFCASFGGNRSHSQGCHCQELELPWFNIFSWRESFHRARVRFTPLFLAISIVSVCYTIHSHNLRPFLLDRTSSTHGCAPIDETTANSKPAHYTPDMPVQENRSSGTHSHTSPHTTHVGRAPSEPALTPAARHGNRWTQHSH